MNYDDLYLLGQIKRLQLQVAAVVTFIGQLGIGGIDGLIQEGTSDPNVAGLLPANTTIGGFYVQKDANGVSIELWTWSKVQNKWI